jgi:hypothetical protein
MFLEKGHATYPWKRATLFMEKDMHALGKGPSAAEVHQQF